MIEMSVDVEGMIFLQHCGEFRCHPHGKGTGNSGADTDDLNGVYFFKPLENILQPPVSEQQRVTARDEDFPDGRRCTQVIKARCNGPVRDHHFSLAHLAFTGAEPAVHGAFTADQKERPVRVFMDQVGYRA